MVFFLWIFLIKRRFSEASMQSWSSLLQLARKGRSKRQARDLESYLSLLIATTEARGHYLLLLRGLFRLCAWFGGTYYRRNFPFKFLHTYQLLMRLLPLILNSLQNHITSSFYKILMRILPDNCIFLQDFLYDS